MLAPIVAHADDAELLPGMLDAVAELADVAAVAVVSGRTVEDLGRFGFPDASRSSGCTAWSGATSERSSSATTSSNGWRALVELASEAAAAPATARGWSSSRRASCSTCARRIPSTAPARPRSCGEMAEEVTGAHVLPGHGVVELLDAGDEQGAGDRGAARRGRRGSVVFVGDDVTDEEVFEALGDDGCSVRVGAGATAARHRLAGPPEVLAFLQELTQSRALTVRG